MEIVNKKIVLVLIIIGIVSSIFTWQNISDNKTKLEIVSLNNETNLSNMFAIMLEQIDEEGNSTYVESEDNVWPSSDEYLYNEVQSGCVDVNGNELEKTLEYDSENNIANIKTEKTSYCYLYFKIRPTAYGTILEGEENISVPIIGGMYRYQGTYDVVDNNYICFGTSNQTDCLNDTDKYMYRIIGITQNNQLKLIKKEALEAGYKWNSNTSSNILWSDSDLNNSLNGTTFLTNEEKNYIPDEWKEKIGNEEWKFGNVGHTPMTKVTNGFDVYAIESAFGDTTKENYDSTIEGIINSKIAIMYIHDFFFSVSNDINCYGGSEFVKCKNGWLHLSNNDENYPSDNEWFINNLGMYGGGNRVWSIYPNGNVNWYYYPNNLLSVRPVFYTITLSSLSGEGTLESPFLIE